MNTFYSVLDTTEREDYPWVHNRRHEFGYHFDSYPDIMCYESAQRIYLDVRSRYPKRSFEVVEFKYNTIPVDPNYYPM